MAAAAVGAILAISTVFAHSTPSTHKSLVSSIVSAAHTASFPVIANEPVPNAVIDKQIARAITAEELAAKIAAEQAELAAKLAALKAAAAADPCIAADAVEDAAERAADVEEDAAEKANPGSESPDEDAKEKAARQAAEAAEGPEVKCAGAASTKLKAFAWFASGDHHFEGRHHH
jgi:hypothetical protein